MIRKFVIHGLIWLIVITFGIQLITGWFSKPKRVGTTSVNENENPFGKKDNNSGSVGDPNGNKKIELPAPPPPNPDVIITKAMLDNNLVEIEKGVKSGGELTVIGTITNQGTDSSMRICADHCQGGEQTATRIYDDAGNKIKCHLLEIGNQSNTLDLDTRFISGVKVPVKMKFTLPTIAGQAQATKIALLEIFGENNQGYIHCDFRNIKIEQFGIPETTPKQEKIPVATATAAPTPTPALTPTSGKTE
ncbi:MAG: hypothetical protein HYR87_07760 [Thaumarchaeota archaeon]|nr:hypothetical protein [Nitrososphaerota archaeon]